MIPSCSSVKLLARRRVRVNKPPMRRGYREASIQQHRQASDLRGFCLCCGNQPTDPDTGRLPFPQILSRCAHYRNPCAHPPRKCKHQGGFPPGLYPSRVGHTINSQDFANPASDQLAEAKLDLEKAEKIADSAKVDHLSPSPGPFRHPDRFSPQHVGQAVPQTLNPEFGTEQQVLLA
ncbi:hypothetical protein PV04_01527 [Phialophora macrospora]|uniref:Uncharacterized protein n=1 Tax=Phialophora macrospora TaxID=1851006 RepID=A0A0D2FY15_9EURO|nr:hypothetical protein PV04_01527 [Phialophora macrospora]